MPDDPDKAIDLLKGKDYLFDSKEVVAIDITNKPGELSKMTKRLGEEGININYVYGSVSTGDGKCLFVFCPEDVTFADSIFEGGTY